MLISLSRDKPKDVRPECLKSYKGRMISLETVKVTAILLRNSSLRNTKYSGLDFRKLHASLVWGKSLWRLYTRIRRRVTRLRENFLLMKLIKRSQSQAQRVWESKPMDTFKDAGDMISLVRLPYTCYRHQAGCILLLNIYQTFLKCPGCAGQFRRAEGFDDSRKDGA